MRKRERWRRGGHREGNERKLCTINLYNGLGMGCVYAKEKCRFTTTLRFDLKAIDNAFHCGATRSQSL